MSTVSSSQPRLSYPKAQRIPGDEYLVHAHETPTWIRMDLFNWIWVPVLSTEGYGPDRK